MLDLVDFHTGGEPTPKMTRRKSQQLSKQRSRNLPEGIVYGESDSFSGSSKAELGSPVMASPATSPIPEASSVHEGIMYQPPMASAALPAPKRNLARML